MDQLTLQLGDRVAAGGDALGRLPDGRVVFCEGGLPGETVRIELVAQRRDFARARVVAVDGPSPERVVAPCPHARAGCGGCQWQHLAVDAQLRHKVEVVADSWRRLARMEPPGGPPPRQVDPGGYRTTLRLAVDGDGRPAYRHRHSNGTVAPDHCLVAHPLLEELISGVRLRPGRPPERPAGRGRGQRDPRAPEIGLRVGVAGGERLVVPSGGAVVVEAPVDAVVVGPKTEAHLHEDVGGRRWQVGGRSFFQSGPQAAGLLAETVSAAAGPLAASDTLVDLYAGVGLLGGVAAARAGCRLVAVESSPGAAADAAANLADLDAEVFAGEVEVWEPVPADVVIADPARSGLGRAGVAAVASTGAGRVVLVSCDPASCARDAALLRDAGYGATSMAILDLFPHTFHMEVVTAFERP
ncbi:TRAM domain-containing protein [Acidiferrimicrobium sp. IK]|uniref:class I SAM-dependent RNA methyltransferase n=1 Tax=Acidiferrimicrobium sp. IK TaxID=2871700 RepID=UPI0021CB95EB|nr:TRAM domain-containing protein [Acidiferrimicrobium sp. IK]MCU4184153.1 TRAM domain-containing protein [Acidiferrimicrobium sp. IK]